MPAYPPWTLHTHVKVNCADCTAECCKHIAIPIDNPEDYDDYQEIADYLQHENVTAYIDHDDEWYVEFKTRCSQLDGNRCMAFKDNKQPRTCTEYSVDNCVMNEEGDYWEEFFSTPQDIAEYALTKGITKAIRITQIMKCDEECCNHVSIPLDAPQAWRDFDDIRWYVAHRSVEVYKDADNDWMCRLTTPRLTPCKRCTQEACRYDETDFPIHFTSMDDVDRHLATINLSAPKEKLKLSSY